MYLYNKRRVAELLDTVPLIRDIRTAKKNQHFVCPYDKLIVCSDKPPAHEFVELIRPARFETDDDETFYQYKLVHDLFSVHWMHVNPMAATTSIMLNPWKHKLMPDEVLALIDFIIGSHFDAQVAHNDDKLDWFQFLNSKDFARRLYVGYQRKSPRDYDDLSQTYLYGKRRGQQVKNYNKAEEQGLDGEIWTRLEKRRKRRDKNSRPTLSQFLLDERNDALKNVVIVDIDKFSGRDKIMRRINKFGTFQEAYMTLTKEEKRKLKLHEAFRHPLVDLGALFKKELDQWLSMSPHLHLMKRIFPVLQSSWSGKDTLTYRTVRIDPINLHFTRAHLEPYVGKEIYRLRQSYFTDE
ncbi:hypothetical protein [Cohnella sp.]|uniref:hypothetical protein n=1 Tax=Cohnella sp. TaxID=1883426 RepID=UPI00356B1D15